MPPQWVLLRHYGWRNQFFTIFPNAVAVKPVEGPDHSVTNWFNIAFLTMLAALVWAIWVRLRRFRKARIDPMLEGVEDNLYAAGDAIAERRGRSPLAGQLEKQIEESLQPVSQRGRRS